MKNQEIIILNQYNNINFLNNVQIIFTKAI